MTTLYGARKWIQARTHLSDYGMNSYIFAKTTREKCRNLY